MPKIKSRQEELDRYLRNIMDEREGETPRELRIRAARHLLRDAEVVYVEGADWIAAFLDEVERNK